MPDHPHCIVLIEDHPLIRAGQRMLLEHAGYRVIEIATAADLAGFEAIPGGSQIIIADFDLGPGMTGIEMAQDIMQRAGEWIPTLVLSASFGERSQAAATACGMPMMFKPAPEEQVLAWVDNAIGQSRPRPDTSPEA